MARRKNTGPRADLAAFDQAGARVFDNPLVTEVSDSYLEYAFSVIHSRALPDARDGLKPVHRRILYSMHEAGHRPDRAHVKSARVVGDVMGRYHPHGDTAIYDAMVRLAQDFSLNVPLIDGHGNFGSPDDGPAAARYCVTGETRIRLPDGSSPQIADLVDLAPDSEADVDFKVLDKDGKAVQVTKVFNSGVHSTIRIGTDSGFSLRGSENHLVLCLEAPLGVPLFQWRRLEEITPARSFVSRGTPGRRWSPRRGSTCSVCSVAPGRQRGGRAIPGLVSTTPTSTSSTRCCTPTTRSWAASVT